MANKELRIDVTANTTAAQKAIADLSEETLGLVKVTEAGGNAMKQAAVQTADATKAQAAAAEAVRRASKALAEHQEITKAFGEDSAEAAASLARLRAAEEAATKATRAAEAALEGAAKAVAETAKTADEKAVAALRRMKAQLEGAGKSAESTASDLRMLEARIESVGNSSKGMGAAMASFAGNLGAGMVGFALDKLGDGLEWAAEHNAQFGATFDRLKDTATATGEALLNGPIGRGLIALVGWASDAIGWVTDLGESLGLFEREVHDTEAALIDYAKANEGALGPLAQMARDTLLTAAAQERLNDAIRVGQRAREEDARKAFVLGRMAEEDAREREARRRQDADRKDKSAADTAKVGRRGQRGPDLSGQGLEAARRYEMETRREREQAFAAEVQAFEEESALRDKRIAGISREIEAIDARGVAEAGNVDFIFGSMEVETEAAQRREQMIDSRMSKEIELARWQLRNAKTQEQREQAQTRLEEAEHAKRIRAMEKAAQAEAKTARQREQVFGTLAAAHNVLAEKMIDMAFAAAEGEKVAVGAMLQELLKGLTKKHALLALAEGALAVGAFASYRYAEGAQHLAAAGLHTAVAVTAGVGAYAVGQVVDIPQGGGGGGGGGSGGGDGGAAKAGTSNSRGRATNDDGDLEAQNTPVSHEILRRSNPSMGRGDGGVTVNIYKPTIAGAGGVKELAATIQREIERSNRSGTRPRN